MKDNPAPSDNTQETFSIGKHRPDDNLENDLTRHREIPFLFLKGFAMGSADVVPGVSGGTMALITGIYSRLIFAIKSVDIKAMRLVFAFNWRELFGHVHWKFLISVLAGAASAVLFFTKVIKLPVLMHTHPEAVYGLFFGLISGSILLLLRAMGPVGWREALTVTAGVAIGWRIVTLVPADTPETALFVFLSGSLAITAMVLPGISGSFILLILQKYDYILGNIALLGTDRTGDAIMVLLPFGFGLVAGLLLFVRILSWLIRRYKVFTLCLLVGFMAGSLYVIWPYQEREYVEIVDVQVVPWQDIQDQEWQDGVRVINPEAPASERLAEVKHVRQKLVSSSPYWPDWPDPESDHRLSNGTVSLYSGMGTMFLGLLLVIYLGWLMNKRENVTLQV